MSPWAVQRTAHSLWEGDSRSMSTKQKRYNLNAALVAAVIRLGVGTAVFEPAELMLTMKYTVRCRRQADGSVAVILEESAH